MRWVAGVDGRRGGWAMALVGVDRRGRAARVSWQVVSGQHAAGARQVLAMAAAAGAAMVGVDAPIGVPEHDWRPCDLLAKRRLGAAAARVFLAPPREVLAAPSYPEARAVARQLLGGRSVSAQTYGLRGIVLALDDALRAQPELNGSVVEVHPELSFMALTGRAPGDPLPSKRTPAGRAARLAALAGWLPPGGQLATPAGEDHLDALAAAWSGWRRLTGEAEQLGGELDRYRIPMRMVI